MPDDPWQDVGRDRAEAQAASAGAGSSLTPGAAGSMERP